MIKRKNDFALVTIIYLFSSFIRLSINYSTEFIPGANGALYLSNVRSILETGEIIFKDFPLIFWLEALLAKLFFVLGIAEYEKSIDLACRLFDSFIPPIAILPAYLLIKRLLINSEKEYYAVLFASLSILFISFMVLVSDFQKNSLGLLWLFSLKLWVYKSLEEKNLINYSISFLFLSLTGITHFGCFLVAVLYIMVVLFVKKLVHRKIELKNVLMIGLLLIVAYVIIYLISPPRLKTVFDFLFNMFRNSTILLLLRGKTLISPIDLINQILINLTSIIAIFFYIKNYKMLSDTHRIFILSSVVLSLILASPLIGIEWSQRLGFISYVPAVMLIPFIFNNVKTESARKLILVITLITVLFSVAVRVKIPTFSNMNHKIYGELQTIKEKLPKDGNVLLVSRHGLEWWVSYILRKPVVRESALEKIYWDRFKYMLFIIQKKDKSPFGPLGIFGPPFREPVLPNSAEQLFNGMYFDIYWSKIPPGDMSIFIEPISY